MKKLKGIGLLLVLMTVLVSCGGRSKSQPNNAKDFEAIEGNLKSEFGDDAYYTNLNIMYDASIGQIITATVTEDPASLKMGEWTFSQGTWTQSSEISLEVPEGTNASDFMYQLDETINLSELGIAVEKSRTKLTAEKELENPLLAMASVKFPKNGDISKAEYTVDLKPENGGTTFSFYYKLDGELIKMDY